MGLKGGGCRNLRRADWVRAGGRREEVEGSLGEVNRAMLEEGGFMDHQEKKLGRD